ncbi:MAG: flagellar biosynthesis anti-sigma factor FlgM [Deltaproteobacteria bacterium]|nr:flagellar biosynthesis anti-sigma factor FlgM [Deltaproteobacteria bacterium]
MRITDKSALVELAGYLKGTDNISQRHDANLKDISKDKADKVELSQRSKEIRKAREVVEASPDIRAEKVDSIKKAVENNAYNIKGEEIARSIIKRSLIDTVL